MSQSKSCPNYRELLADVAEMNALFDLQRKRMRKAVRMWRSDTKHTYQPDLGELLEWLMKRRTL